MNQSIEDLQRQLAEYNVQLEEVNEVLQEEPENQELLELKKNLVDVIKMTQDLLELKKQTTPKNKQPTEESSEDKAKIFHDIALRKGFYVGMPAEAKWSDGQWYPAKIADINERGFFVIFDGFEEPEQVTNSSFLSIKEIKSLTHALFHSSLSHHLHHLS
jgi:survival-of-motor-neuron-related-splicing factor 30